ncbi:TPA: hypothetical protein ACQVHP_002962 [Serratia marcescens]
MSEEKKVRLYMHGIKYLEDGSEAEYVDVDESQQFALFALGWRVPEALNVPGGETLSVRSILRG